MQFRSGFYTKVSIGNKVLGLTGLLDVIRGFASPDAASVYPTVGDSGSPLYCPDSSGRNLLIGILHEVQIEDLDRLPIRGDSRNEYLKIHYTSIYAVASTDLLQHHNTAVKSLPDHTN
jgi:hypothetical protein